MSYLVIARKWRPQTFEEVIGQPHATRTLQNAIRLDRIAHAYLFTGARGVGKTSVARILAKSLNCEKGPAPTPCNQCSNCREIAAGNSIDVIEIDGASNRGIDNIRELRETVRYRPAKGRYKVYIIDEVHMLTTEAFNALLKTLEEPPPHVVFIFATTEPHKIPATILSRCQRFDFRRVALPGLVEHLKRITEGEGAHFSDGVLFAIAREADGSMRDAQSLLEQLLAFSGDGLPDEEILDILGVIDRRSVLRAGEAVLSGDAEGCLDLVETLYRRGIDSRRFCQHLCDHFRNLLFMSIGQGRDSRLDLPDEEKDYLKAQASLTSSDSLHIYFQMLLRGEEEIRRSSMPKIALEMLLLRMSQLPRLNSFDELLDRIAELETSLGPGGRGHAPRPARTAQTVSGRCGSIPEQNRGQQKAGSSTPAPANNEQPPPSTARSERIPAQKDNPPENPIQGTSVPPTDPHTVRKPSSEIAVAPAGAGTFSPPPTAPGVSEVELPSPVEPVEKTPDAPLPDSEILSPETGPHPVDVALEQTGAKAARSITAQGAIERWAEFIRFLESNHPMLWARISHCGIKTGSERVLELEVPEIFEKSVNGPDFLEKLPVASEAFFGVGLEWVIIKKEHAKGISAQKTKAPKSSGKQIISHPAVQQAIEILGGELVEVKPHRVSGPGGTRSGKKNQSE